MAKKLYDLDPFYGVYETPVEKIIEQYERKVENE